MGTLKILGAFFHLNQMIGNDLISHLGHRMLIIWARQINVLVVEYEFQIDRFQWLNPAQTP